MVDTAPPVPASGASPMAGFAPNRIDTDRIDAVAAEIRRRVFEHVLKNNGGYLSQALSSAEIFACLYTDTLNIGPVVGEKLPGLFPGVPGPDNPGYTTGGRFNGPHEPHLDRLLFSPAHYALVLYAALIAVGRLDEAALDQFNVDGSTMEMIGAEHSPGVETTTGSLAQALSQANGIALARRMKGETGRTWVMMSDGEFEEGQTWEALAFASYHQLNGLRVVVDANGQQCDGIMSEVANIEPLAERITSFGWAVRDVNGHDSAALAAAMADPVEAPLVVIARTDPAYTLPLFAERAPKLHYLRFTSPEERARYETAYAELAGSTESTSDQGRAAL